MCTIFIRSAMSRKGGARPGAGRPKGTGKYGEPTRAIRVPESAISDIQSWLLERKPEKAKSTCNLQILKPTKGKVVNLPLYANRIPAGFPSPADDHIDVKLNIHEHLVKNPAATFYVRVEGESMLGAGIHPDDILVVDRSITPVSGKIVIAVVDGELTVKRLAISNGQVLLRAENPSYPDIKVKSESDLMVWGVVTNVIHAV